jgi:hypothetical protein
MSAEDKDLIQKDLIEQLVTSQRKAAAELRRLTSFSVALQSDHVELQAQHALATSQLYAVTSFLLRCPELGWLHAGIEEVRRLSLPTRPLVDDDESNRGEPRQEAADDRRRRLRIAQTALEGVMNDLHDCHRNLRRSKGCQVTVTKLNVATAGVTAPRLSVVAKLATDVGASAPAAGKTPQATSLTPLAARTSLRTVAASLPPSVASRNLSPAQMSLPMPAFVRHPTKPPSRSPAGASMGLLDRSSSPAVSAVTPSFEPLAFFPSSASLEATEMQTTVVVPCAANFSRSESGAAEFDFSNGDSFGEDTRPLYFAEQSATSSSQMNASAVSDMPALPSTRAHQEWAPKPEDSAMGITHETVVSYFVEDFCALVKNARDEFVEVAALCAQALPSADDCLRQPLLRAPLGSARCANMSTIHESLADWMQRRATDADVVAGPLATLETLTMTWNVMLGVMRQINHHIFCLHQRLADSAAPTPGALVTSKKTGA